MRLGFVLLVFCCCVRAQMVVGTVSVSGNRRLPAEAIVQLTGLHNGTPFSDKKLNEACHKLVDSGLFTSANYSYTPKKTATGYAYAVGFNVTEDATLVSVVLDVDGFENADLWTKLKQVNGLLDPQMPDNDGAQTYYQNAIAAALAESGGRTIKLGVKREADLGSGRMRVVFRNVDAATLATVTFEGNSAVPSEVLEKAVHAIVIGQPYSERDLRQVITLNLTPLYEERGYLRVTFPRITRVSLSPTAAGASITVEEGRCWKLGKVDFTGDHLPVDQMLKAAEFPSGEVANWRLITASLEKAQRVLRAEGYLRVSTAIDRRYDDSKGNVDLQLTVTRGPQFLLGSMRFEGIDEDMQDLLSRRWKLHDGDPVDEPYTDEYWSQVYRLGGHSIKKVEKHLSVRPGTTTVDIVYTISSK